MSKRRLTAASGTGEVKMSDVARRAGVSTATVSRTLTTPGSVNADTRERVLEAVRDLGYTPNAAARNLRVRRTMMVLVVVPRLANPLFTSVIAHIDREISRFGFGLIIGDLANGDGKEDHLLTLIRARHVDGVIIMSPRDPDLGLRVASETTIPTVGVCTPILHPKVPNVLCDDKLGGRMQASHIAGLGHKRVLYLAGWRDSYNDAQRRLGVLEGLSEAGISGSDVQVFEGDYTYEAGTACGQNFLALPANDRPTAVISASDEMAIGFMKAVISAGLRIPQDVSVIGFDGVDPGVYFHPGLTTIRQPSESIGVESARALLTQMNGTAEKVEVRLEVPGLYQSGSTGPALSL